MPSSPFTQAAPPRTLPSMACVERRLESELLDGSRTHPSRNAFASSSLCMANKVPHDVGGDLLRCVASLPAWAFCVSCAGANHAALNVLQEGLSYKARDIPQQHARGGEPSRRCNRGVRTSQGTRAVCCHQRQAVQRMMHIVVQLKAPQRVCL